jgi:hypothetical protein
LRYHCNILAFILSFEDYNQTWQMTNNSLHISLTFVSLPLFSLSISFILHSRNTRGYMVIFTLCLQGKIKPLDKNAWFRTLCAGKKQAKATIDFPIRSSLLSSIIYVVFLWIVKFSCSLDCSSLILRSQPYCIGWSLCKEVFSYF